MDNIIGLQNLNPCDRPVIAAWAPLHPAVTLFCHRTSRGNTRMQFGAAGPMLTVQRGMARIERDLATAYIRGA